MSALCLNVCICRLCVPNIMSLGVCFKKFHPLMLAHLLDMLIAWKLALFSVSGLKDKKLIKSKPTWKLKHANFILESFEYFYPISWKSILIILSYTVSKLVHFLDTMYTCRAVRVILPYSGTTVVVATVYLAPRQKSYPGMAPREILVWQRMCWVTCSKDVRNRNFLFVAES